MLKYTREGRLEWGATYKQPYESMYDEGIVDTTNLSGTQMAEENSAGCDLGPYWNEDVPGRSLQMAQILSKSGIPNMQFSRFQPGIYNWYSPDGSFVTCYTPGQYDEVGIPVRLARTDSDSLSQAFSTILTGWNGYFKSIR